MFYPILENLKQNKIDMDIIKKLDGWLGTRRKAIWKSLNPLQFSIDSGIDEDLSLYLFILCDNLKLLKVQYIVHCSLCDANLNKYKSIKDIPEKIFCNECNNYININEEDIIVYFELLIPPTDFLYNSSDLYAMSTENFVQKKADSLRLATIEDEDMRRLFEKMS